MVARDVGSFQRGQPFRLYLLGFHNHHIELPRLPGRLQRGLQEGLGGAWLGLAGHGLLVVFFRMVVAAVLFDGVPCGLRRGIGAYTEPAINAAVVVLLGTNAVCVTCFGNKCVEHNSLNFKCFDFRPDDGQGEAKDG